ncbi:hypothetical protein [Mycobacterium paraterrae]|uniref:Uncharacterized protein n=1 Tax=Mycobacterium paraterrae TaxID=577492 RepID=A0ABY3VNT5_9MYCO|nr:hypothetical protein [Mycobacterium paraterrae]UMB68821.1 hypothetical protein MKK62_20840 [Mycobacterium paraterrae]
MSDTTAISAPTSDVAHTTAQTPPKPSAPNQAPVLITEQEVLFGTRSALSGRLSMPRRLFAAVRSTASSWHLPPPRQHYPSDMGYLEQSRMAREMDRL